MKRIALFFLIFCLATITACADTDGDDGSQSSSESGLNVTVDIQGQHDIHSLEYTFKHCDVKSDPIYTKEKALDDLHVVAHNSYYLMVEKFFPFGAGCYDVSVVPITGDGTPSQKCPVAKSINHTIEKSIKDKKVKDVLLIIKCDEKGIDNDFVNDANDFIDINDKDDKNDGDGDNGNGDGDGDGDNGDGDGDGDNGDGDNGDGDGDGDNGDGDNGDGDNGDGDGDNGDGDGDNGDGDGDNDNGDGDNGDGDKDDKKYEECKKVYKDCTKSPKNYEDCKKKYKECLEKKCPKDPVDPIIEEICPRTQGFWRNHPDQWETDGTIFGQSWMDVLTTPPAGGDMCYILGAQYVAAQLNIASGAYTPEDPDIAAAIAESEQIFQSYCPGLDGQTEYDTTRDDAEKLKDLLEALNEGDFATGACVPLDAIR